MGRNNNPTDHFKKRVAERMPDWEDPKLLWNLLRRMRREDSPKLKFIMRVKLKASAYRFVFQGHTYWVIIDDYSGRPRTIYCEGMWIKNKNGKVKYVGGKRFGAPRSRKVGRASSPFSSIRVRR